VYTRAASSSARPGKRVFFVIVRLFKIQPCWFQLKTFFSVVNEDVSFRRNLFDEFKRAQSEVSLQKVVVNVKSADNPEKSVLINKGISTPFHVAKRMLFGYYLGFVYL